MGKYLPDPSIKSGSIPILGKKIWKGDVGNLGDADIAGGLCAGWDSDPLDLCSSGGESRQGNETILGQAKERGRGRRTYVKSVFLLVLQRFNKKRIA